MQQTILVTGGAGYIGSHTCVCLLEAGYQVIVVDNFSNSNIIAPERVQQITGKTFTVHPVDICDRKTLAAVFAEHDIDAVIHFAGFKAVGESIEQPLNYYHNNIYGTITLCEVMAEAGVKTMIFSSSATVYGMNDNVPFKESAPTSATNPYGHTKLFIEQILQDVCIADPEWTVTLLRYFNPVGAHHSGLIGEDPNGVPNNLMPFISQVAVGRLKKLKIFGNDYPTPDGTGVRDYIHVIDLADGHVKALESTGKQKGVAIYNLGTGHGISVLDVVTTFEKINGIPIPYKIVPRRPGDIASSFADPKKAKNILQWIAKKTLEDMVRDAWNWQQKNPNGYA
ncbi:MAG: UDP-glucose 4-epimerase GalE [Candidatus Marinimicrobia bacterium]|nr:UDP-glucose 4-epimerase GalE [Candidatus Neomarinimicrobiota bacterium]